MFEEMSSRRCGTVPLVSLRSSFSGSSDEDNVSIVSSKGGLCSDNATGGENDSLPPASVRIKHLTRHSVSSSRFPKLDECAHFHYDNVELPQIRVELCEEEPYHSPAAAGGKFLAGGSGDHERMFGVRVTSHARTWLVRRTYDNFRLLDRQLHRCVYDRKYSLLPELGDQLDNKVLEDYLARLSDLAGNMINCGPVLNWFELDNRGNRLLVTDEAAINTPAVAAAYAVRPYTAHASDEISFAVGDMISVIDMPPTDESTWWRGKKGFEVGFFPCEAVEIIGEKIPRSLHSRSTKPVLRKHGKLIAFFRSFLISRPSRRKLKQTGILKERVFSCDLGEHLSNTGRDIPLVLKACTEFIEKFGIVDGIYRLSGVTSNIQKLRNAFDEDVVPELGDDAIRQDIHSVASLLKMYFRELPNPLLTYQLYDKFVGAVHTEGDARLLRLRELVQQLPPPHYRTLKHLTLHLSLVASHGHRTGMTPKNVAIVWAPNLLRSKSIENGGVGALHVIGTQAVLTEYLIRYADIIFNGKMPSFNTPKLEEGTPRRNRPKSLAISTPTKLLSLEEARSRVNASNLQKYIDVGGGPNNLPPKYHTVIDLPLGKRGSVKLKKSPSGWKSFFSRGWHSGSTREKERKGPAIRKVSTGSLQTSPPMSLQDQAILGDLFAKNLRSFKSAESLVLLSGSSCRNSQDENSLEIRPPSFKNSLPSPSIGFQKHGRSTSHDSYFDHPDEQMSSEWEELVTPSSPPQGIKKQKLDDDADSYVERYGTEETVLVEVHATCSPDDSPQLYLRRLSPLSVPQLFLDCELNVMQRNSQISSPSSSSSSLEELANHYLESNITPLPQSHQDMILPPLVEARNPICNEDYFYQEDCSIISHQALKHQEEEDASSDYQNLVKRPSSSLMELDNIVMMDTAKGILQEDEDKMSENIDPSQENTLFDCCSLASEVISPREATEDSSLLISDYFFQLSTPILPIEALSQFEDNTAKDIPSDSFSSQNTGKPTFQDIELMEVSQPKLSFTRSSSNHEDISLHHQDIEEPSSFYSQECFTEDIQQCSLGDETSETISDPLENINSFPLKISSTSGSDTESSAADENLPLETKLALQFIDSNSAINEIDEPNTTHTELEIIDHNVILLGDTVQQNDVIKSEPESRLVEHYSENNLTLLLEQAREPEEVETNLAYNKQIKRNSSRELIEKKKTSFSMPSLVEPPKESKEDTKETPVSETSPRKPSRPNFQQLFSKFEKPKEVSPSKTPPSLFTQYKILKLQSHMGQRTEVPNYDPWKDPILDRYNDVDVESSPTKSMSEKEIKSQLIEDVSDTHLKEGSENIPPPNEETITIKTFANQDGIKTSITSTLSSGTTIHDVMTVTVSDGNKDNDPEYEEKTRRERINKIKEARRAQLREKIKLENVTGDNKQPRILSTRKSWVKTTDEGEENKNKAIPPAPSILTVNKFRDNNTKQHSRPTVGKRSPNKDKKDLSPSKIPTKCEDSIRTCDKPPLQRIGQRRIHERAAMFERPLSDQPERRGRFIHTPTVIR